MRIQKKQQSVRSEKERTNSDWVLALQGSQGAAEQQKSHMELANYLYIVSINYIHFRQPSVSWLAQADDEELAAVAEDSIQQFFLKLMKDDYGLLTKYNGRGRFLSWTAQIMRNMVASELRRPHWQRRASLEEVPVEAERPAASGSLTKPELAVQFKQLTDLVQDALACMSAKNRTIFVRYVLDGERASVVAEELGISTNGVYISAHRMRKEVKEILIGAGFGSPGIKVEAGI
ncbi:MAG: sigma-70 family RNA polymerase sigma factor [Chloroflexota bacterium]